MLLHDDEYIVAISPCIVLAGRQHHRCHHDEPTPKILLQVSTYLPKTLPKLRGCPRQFILEGRLLMEVPKIGGREVVMSNVSDTNKSQ